MRPLAVVHTLRYSPQLPLPSPYLPGWEIVLTNAALSVLGRSIYVTPSYHFSREINTRKGKQQDTRGSVYRYEYGLLRHR